MSEFSVKTLGEIALIGSGGTPNRKIDNYWGGDIPWVTTKEIDFGDIYDVHENITERGLRSSAAKVISSNAILMAMYGQGKTRGKVAILRIDAATNQACATILVDRRVAYVEFVFHSLASKYSAIRSLSNSGGARKSQFRVGKKH